MGDVAETRSYFGGLNHIAEDFFCETGYRSASPKGGSTLKMRGVIHTILFVPPPYLRCIQVLAHIYAVFDH